MPEDKKWILEYLYKMMQNSENTLDDSEDNKHFRKGAREHITERDKQFTALVQHFVKITRIRNIIKEIVKWVFLVVVLVFFVAVIIKIFNILDIILFNVEIESIIEYVPAIITAVVGLVSTIIGVPMVIAQYLFSTKEDENITAIISHTQDHDTSGREWITKNDMQEKNE